MRRRVGVMGGTFDPIHHGHLVAASEVQAWFDLDEVVFVPTGLPWQKAAREVTAAEHRYLMTVIATASNPRFRVSRVDIDRDGPTYTIDTLRDLSSALAADGGEGADGFPQVFALPVLAGFAVEGAVEPVHGVGQGHEAGGHVGEGFRLLSRPVVEGLASGVGIVGLAGAAQFVQQGARARAGLRRGQDRRLAACAPP